MVGGTNVQLGRGFYDRLAVGAFLFVPVALAVVRVLMAVTDSTMPSGQIGPLYVISIFCIVLGALFFIAGYRTRWASVPVIVVSVLLLLVGLLFGSWGLSHPDSFFDFVPGLIIVAGPLVALASILTGRHKHRKGPVAPGGYRQHFVIGTLIAVFLVGAATSGATTALSRRKLQLPRGAVVVYAENNRFHPSTVSGRAGRVLTIAVVNRDSYSHQLSPDRSELLTSEYIGPLTTKIIRLRVAKAQRLDKFSCDVTGHSGMEGRIEISPR